MGSGRCLWDDRALTTRSAPQASLGYIRYMSENKTTLPRAVPAATVIVLRDAESGQKGLEVLLLRRNAKTAFHGGAWVFPGGHIDPEDHNPDAPDDMLAAARQAAVREAAEEAGLSLATETLLYFSHWTTPLIRPKRFSTWFFVAQAGGDAVQVDGTEISDHAWMRPHEALEARQAGEIELPPPTFVSLTKLSAFSAAKNALAYVSGREPDTFFPKLEKVEGGYCSLYHGDAGYESSKVAAPGRRHRLWMLKSGWRYERARQGAG